MIRFRQIFGRVNDLKQQNIKTGGVAVLKDNSRYIYYLVTKGKTYERPTYDSLTKSLNAMKEHMVFKSLSFLIAYTVKLPMFEL